MVAAARIVPRGRHEAVLCPCCGRTLGEVYDDHVTVKAGERMLIFPVTADVRQLCPKCGTESRIHKETAA